MILHIELLQLYWWVISFDLQEAKLSSEAF